MHTRKRPLTAVTAAVCSAVAVATLAPQAATAAAQLPDLQVKSAKVDKASITEGDTLRISHVVQNQGKAPARSSVTRFYLTTDVRRSLAERRASRTAPRSALGDILLEGDVAAGTVRPGRTVTPKPATVTVPVGTPPGSYRVLVCTEDRGAVRESDEADNCRAATTALKVKEAVGTDPLEVRTFSDTYPWPANEDLNLSYIKAFCGSAYPAKSYSLSSALVSVRARLEELAPGGLAQVRSSGLAADATQAQQLAAGALSAGSPGLAMAAMLEAHRLEPANGRHLVNAAALATSISLPNQAIAFLDAAVGRDFLRPAGAVPHQASALAVRGHALLMLGKYDAAQPLFVRAKQMAPLMTEPDVGLATVAACRGDDAVAARHLRRSRAVSDEPVPAVPPVGNPGNPGDPEHPEIERAEPALDLSHGVAGDVRQLPIARTPSDAVEMRDVYYGIKDDLLAEAGVSNTARAQATQRLRAIDAERTYAEVTRRGSILTLLYGVGARGEVAAAEDELSEAIDELNALDDEFWGEGTGENPGTYQVLADAARARCNGSQVPNCYKIEINKTCRPALLEAHESWRQLMVHAQNHANSHFALWSKRMSAYAANLAEPDAHLLGLLQIDTAEQVDYGRLVQQAQIWTNHVRHYRDDCVAPVPPEVLNPPTDWEPASPGECPPALRGVNFRLKLGAVTAKVNCERVEVSVSQNVAPLLAVFADVKWDSRSGNISVWSGLKLGATVGNVVDVGLKSGVYMKIGPDGEFVDAGMRVGPSLSLVGSISSFSAYKHEVDFSFTSSTTPGY